MDKKNHALLSIFLSVIIILLCVFGFINTLNYKREIKVIGTYEVSGVKEKYSAYLNNLEYDIKSRYGSYVYSRLSCDNLTMNSACNFTITNDLKLLYNTTDGKYQDYVISEEVLNMFLVTSGNGGFRYLYYIKTDGTLNRVCVEDFNGENEVSSEVMDNLYVVNVYQGLIDAQADGSYKPIFVDINGNITY